MATSETEALAAELAQAVNAIAQAQQQTGPAAEHARGVSSQAAATGLAAVASALGGIADQISALNGPVGEATGRAQRAGVAVRGVTDQTSPEEARGHLTRATQELDGMRAALLAAAQQINTIRGSVEAALRGGQPGPLLQRLDVIRQCLVIAAQRGDAVKSQVSAVVSRTGQLGN